MITDNENLEELKLFKVKCRDCKIFISETAFRQEHIFHPKTELLGSEKPHENMVQTKIKKQNDVCECYIADVNCRGCGNLVGWHILFSCTKCWPNEFLNCLWFIYENKIMAE